MSTVTLLDPGGKCATYSLPYGNTLLNLANTLRLPLGIDCRMENCGACAVKVAVLDGRTGCKGQQRGEVEKSILYRAGKLSREQFVSEDVSRREPVWRLACQYVLGNEEILVAL